MSDPTAPAGPKAPSAMRAGVPEAPGAPPTQRAAEAPGAPEAPKAPQTPTRPVSRVAVGAGLVAAVALSLWMVANLWGPGPPSGDDTMAHMVRAEFTIRDLLPHLDGWQPQFGLGYQQFLFYGPGFTWLVAMVHGLGLGLVSIAGAFKVATVLAVIALPLSVAFLARSFSLNPLAAGLAAILSLTVSSPFGGVGLPGTFGAGLIPNQLGGVFFCLAFGGVLRVMADPRAGWVLFTGLATAALFVTHAIAALILVPFLVIVLPTFLLTDRLSARLVRRLAAAGGLAAGLAAFWLVPSFAHRDLRGILTSWTNPTLLERLDQILHQTVLFQRGIVWFVLVGWLFGLWRVVRGQRWALGLVAAPLVYLVIADLFLRWNPTNLVSLQLMNRGLGFVGVLAVLPLAALLSGIAARQPWRHVGEVGAICCAVALVLASGPVRDVVRQQAPTPQLQAMAAELSRVVPDGARFATQRDFPRELSTTGVSHPDFWLAWASGRNTLNIFNVESSTTPGPDYEPDRMTSQPPDQAADELLRLGVSHVALTSDQAQGAGAMLSSPRFRVLWRQEPMAVLAVQPHPGFPAPGSPLSTDGPGEVSLLEVRPEHLEAAVQSERPGLVTAAIAWSPKWHATVDGQPVRLGRSGEGLLTLPLPAGPSRVVLEFRSDGWDRLGVGATLLTLAALATWAAWWRRSRSTAATASAAG
jgi:6-pyruvoyl-tetrahydropterin synthase related domain